MHSHLMLYLDLIQLLGLGSQDALIVKNPHQPRDWESAKICKGTRVANWVHLIRFSTWGSPNPFGWDGTPATCRKKANNMRHEGLCAGFLRDFVQVDGLLHSLFGTGQRPWQNQ